MSDKIKDDLAEKLQGLFDNLFTEVVDAYEELLESESEDGEPPSFEAKVLKAQINAVKFTRSWVMGGGTTDLDGNRICLPW